MNTADLITVIIPVYKTQPYLRKCVDSVRRQTYTNLEIILVDDGSPDECPVICDEYAALDQRIRVIHQENAGLSAARNRGLDEAAGEWIGFVDSDDWIDPEMYEALMANAELGHAQMAVCGVVREDPQGHTIESWCPEPYTLSCARAHRFFLTDGKGREYPCNKLFRKDVFHHVRFPVNRLYEDSYVLHLLVENTDMVALCATPGYHYVQHPGNISSGLDLFRQMDGLYAKQAKLEFYSEHYPELIPLAQAEVQEACCWLLHKWWQGGADRSSPCFPILMKAFREGLHLRFPRSPQLRGAELLIRISPRLFGRCYHWYIRKR